MLVPFFTHGGVGLIAQALLHHPVLCWARSDACRGGMEPSLLVWSRKCDGMVVPECLYLPFHMWLCTLSTR